MSKFREGDRVEVIAGEIPDTITNEDLVGRKIQIESKTPYLYLAHYLTLLEDE